MVHAREPRGAYSADKWIFQKGGMFGSPHSAGGWAARILLNLDLIQRRQQTRRINCLWQHGGREVRQGGFGWAGLVTRSARYRGSYRLGAYELQGQNLIFSGS